jgi:hypothetical protein
MRLAQRSAGLKAAERTRNASDKAWAMRRAFDSVREQLAERKKMITTLLAGANSAAPLIAAVLTGCTAAAAARLAAGDDVDRCARASHDAALSFVYACAHGGMQSPSA